MKPPPFTYHDPETIDDALAVLAGKDNAKLLAGGQSLMPMLNMRFVLPDDVIDLNRVDGLAGIETDGATLRIGGMTRQRDIEYSETVAETCPLMREAILQVGHRQTRNRGTIGGSLSHLDPSAELPTVAAALDATIHVRSARGARDVAMADFPVAYMTPALEPDEILTGVSLPLWPAGHGYAFVEFARRHGDFAIVSAAVLLELEAGGAIARASVTVSGVGPAPVRCAPVEQAIAGQAGSEALFREAAEWCRGIDAMGDVFASSDYRKHLAAVLARRALVKAHARATGAAEE